MSAGSPDRAAQRNGPRPSQNCGRMNARGRLQLRMQLRYGARNRGPGIARANNRAAGFVYEIVRNQKACCPGKPGQLDRAPIRDERKVLFARLFQRRHAADFAVSFTLPGRFQPNGQFLDTQALGLLSLKGYSIWGVREK